MYNTNDRYIGRALEKYGEISRGETALFAQVVRPGMTVVEVGANIGTLTLPLARLAGQSGKVIAFEPQRVVYQMLCGNLALNAITNVVAHNTAVGREPGKITVPVVDYSLVGNFGGVSLGVPTGETVPLVTIDQLALSSCEFMKIDVEGMERDVIEGAATTIRQFRPRICVENDRAEHSAALIDQLLSLDYRLYWHLPPLYDQDNVFGDKENIFEGVVSVNMICIPRSGSLAVGMRGFREITSKNANWQATT